MSLVRRKKLEMKLVDIIEESGVAFGTSGARGLVTSLTDRVAYAYSTAFLNYLKENGQTFFKKENETKQLTINQIKEISKNSSLDHAA